MLACRPRQNNWGGNNGTAKQGNPEAATRSQKNELSTLHMRSVHKVMLRECRRKPEKNSPHTWGNQTEDPTPRALVHRHWLAGYTLQRIIVLQRRAGQRSGNHETKTTGVSANRILEHMRVPKPRLHLLSFCPHYMPWKQDK